MKRLDDLKDSIKALENLIGKKTRPHSKKIQDQLDQQKEDLLTFKKGVILIGGGIIIVFFVTFIVLIIDAWRFHGKEKQRLYDKIEHCERHSHCDY